MAGVWSGQAFGSALFPHPSLPIEVPTFVGMTGVRFVSERFPASRSPLTSP